MHSPTRPSLICNTVIIPTATALSPLCSAAGSVLRRLRFVRAQHSARVLAERSSHRSLAATKRQLFVSRRKTLNVMPRGAIANRVYFHCSFVRGSMTRVLWIRCILILTHDDHEVITTVARNVSRQTCFGTVSFNARSSHSRNEEGYRSVNVKGKRICK